MTLLKKKVLGNESQELMLATVDNPSNATEWALAEMLNKPELLERATKEIDDVVGRDRLVKESDLPSLNYIKACAKESFRRHPVAPFNIPHVALVDTVVNGYTIPKGSHVLLSRSGLGQNPRVWEKPLEFMPERHLKSDGTNVVLTDSEFKILSFSSGRRGCLAVNLGTNITTMLLARLVQGFTWSVPTNMKQIDLNESEGDLFVANPVFAWAKPRLAPHLYP